MTSLQEVADRCEIDALRGEFADAAMRRDYERFAGLFTVDGVWRMPHVDVTIIGRDEIRAGVERLHQMWEFAVQHTHPGSIKVEGDVATGRAYVAELGRLRNGMAHQNLGVYHDGYRRTADGWRFSERTYELQYVDTSAIGGRPPSG
jgi:ketosteroid isomerase-like protein